MQWTDREKDAWIAWRDATSSEVVRVSCLSYSFLEPKDALKLLLLILDPLILYNPVITEQYSKLAKSACFDL